MSAMPAQRALPLEFPDLRRGLDPLFCLAVAVLLGWGIVMVASASVAVGDQAKYGFNPFYFLERQMLFLVLGLGAGSLMLTVPMATWQRLGPLLLMSAFALLVFVLIPGIGKSVGGSRRWIDFVGLFRLQASEPARLAILIYLSGYIVRRQDRLVASFKGLILPFVPLAIASFLLLREPDFGAAAILIAVAMIMLFIGGARLDYLLGMFAVVAVLLVMLVMFVDYRADRVTGFLRPWEEATGRGYQLTQSLIAVGRGELFGVGLGNSIQKMQWLPEVQTDFIFAVLAEEFGLLGVIGLLGLFGVLVWRGYAIGREAELRDERFKAYLCYGLASWLGLQSTINMAVNMGLLPTKGLTLPFISYGGSSLVTVCLIVGLILRVDHENRRTPAPGGVSLSTPRRPSPSPAASASRWSLSAMLGRFRRRGA